MSGKRWTRLAPALAPALLILVGVALRAAGMTAYRFHVDEALYATHAREVAAGGDPLLLAFDVDKPPLAVYITAAAFALLGVSEFAARLPNVLASALSLAALWALAARLYAPRRGGIHALPTAFFAVLLVALSPYDVLFAPTVFAEPQVTLWTLLACRAIVCDRWMWAGGFMALALATKQSALFAFPLVLALGVVGCAGAEWRSLARRLARFALPALVGVALLAAWDAPRGPERSFWALGYAHNFPDRWIRSGEVLPRLAQWAGWLRTFTGADALSAALLAAVGAGLAWSVWKRPRRRETAVDLTLAGFTLAYLGLLWLRAFNTYDRYLHTLLPLLALLAARGIVRALSSVQTWASAQRGVLRQLNGLTSATLTGLAIAACMAGSLRAALAGKVPVGGDKGAYDGIDAAAAFLRRLPAGTQVCDHWLGWELGFYMGRDAPVPLTWLPRPDALPTHAPCYLPAPADALISRWLAMAARAGLHVEKVFETRDRWGAPSFVVYAVREKDAAFSIFAGSDPIRLPLRPPTTIPRGRDRGGG